MLTKQPDYTISELGYPQLHQLNDYGFHKKCLTQAPKCINSHSSSPNRLLPLRETLDDYNRRLMLLSEQTAKVESQREWNDMVAQQKRQKNLQNEQQQRRDNNNYSRGNQKCRDRAQGTQRMTTPPSTTFVTCDLNSF